MPTVRGPTRFNHRPPTTAEKPRNNQSIEKVRETCEMLQPNSLTNGMRKTLQAYPAPKAICMQTPATAIHQRLIEGMAFNSVLRYGKRRSRDL